MFTAFLIVVAIILLGILWFIFYRPGPLPLTNSKQGLLSSVCVNGNCFQVELARTETERDRGLMYRTELDKNKGMLFIFDNEGIYPFWMKNTVIPLDMLWIDGNGKVVFIAQNVQPCKTLICPSVFPTGSAKYVLELSAGMCQQFGLKVGDKIDINIK